MVLGWAIVNPKAIATIFYLKAVENGLDTITSLVRVNYGRLECIVVVVAQQTARIVKVVAGAIVGFGAKRIRARPNRIARGANRSDVKIITGIGIEP